MQLEAGKKYTDRRGRVYGPLVKTFGKFFGEHKETPLWDHDGRICDLDLDMDLVAEYVEPEQPEYRMLQDGEIVQPGDEYCGHSGKWEKVPSTGNVFRSSLCYPHRRLVEPVKAAEPADNRTAPGEGYRLLDIGEVELDTDEWYSHMDGEWSPTSLAGCEINKIDVEQGYSIRRKVEQPAPVESPDDWVTQDRVPERVGIDEWRMFTEGNGKRTGESSWSETSAGQTWFGKHGDNRGSCTMEVRCRRKDLPPVPPKTRTVVLKEWICWDDCEPEAVTVDWFSLDPSEDHGQFLAYDHAVETGNTRTVEIPVT